MESYNYNVVENLSPPVAVTTNYELIEWVMEEFWFACKLFLLLEF